MFRRISAILVLALLAAGCRENYLAEKEFWKAERVLRSIPIAEVTDYTEAITAFEKVYTKFPSTPKAADALFAIANLHIRGKNFNEARKTLKSVIQNFSTMRDKAPEARYRIAQLYEAESKWDEAEKAYWELAEYHQFHQRGLFAPVHIIIHYKQENNPEAQLVAYNKAKGYYQGLLKQIGPITSAAGVKNFLAMAHLGQGNWREAKATWIELAKEYPDSTYAPLALLAAAELSWNRENYADAEEYFGRFFSDYPRHHLQGAIARQLGILYQSKKSFVKAREWLQKAIDIQEGNSEIVGELKLQIARSYQFEEKWDKADELLKEIEAKHKGTRASYQVPLVRSLALEEAGETEKAQETLNAALKSYKKLEKSSKNPELVNYAIRLQNAALIRKGDWQNLLGRVDDYIEREDSQAKKGQWEFMKAVITENRMQKKDEAVGLYQKFVTEYPDHPLAKTARARQSVLSGQGSAGAPA